MLVLFLIQCLPYTVSKMQKRQPCLTLRIASTKIFLTTFAASLAAELAEAEIDTLVIVIILIIVNMSTHFFL